MEKKLTLTDEQLTDTLLYDEDYRPTLEMRTALFALADKAAAPANVEVKAKFAGFSPYGARFYSLLIPVALIPADFPCRTQAPHAFKGEFYRVTCKGKVETRSTAAVWGRTCETKFFVTFQ